MCWCNPSIRTPKCRNIHCVPPKAYTLEEQRSRAMLKECVILLTHGTEEHCFNLASEIETYLEENNNDSK